jgi:hypothetical protein
MLRRKSTPKISKHCKRRSQMYTSLWIHVHLRWVGAACARSHTTMAQVERERVRRQRIRGQESCMVKSYLDSSLDCLSAELADVLPNALEDLLSEHEAFLGEASLELPKQEDVALINLSGAHRRLKARVGEMREKRLLRSPRRVVGERGKEGEGRSGEKEVIARGEEEIAPEVELVVRRGCDDARSRAGLGSEEERVRQVLL